MSSLTGDDLLWNWARWTWSGCTVGNMAVHYAEDVDPRPINHDHAMAVEAMHAALPWHERMIVIAEYTQKGVRFDGMGTKDRRKAAREWIAEMTGVTLTDAEYRIYLGLFRNEVERKIR